MTNDEYTLIENDYRPLFEDEENIRNIKDAIWSLPEHKRRIFLLYTELGSYSAVARELNCSSPTVAKYIKELKEEMGL